MFLVVKAQGHIVTRLGGLVGKLLTCSLVPACLHIHCKTKEIPFNSTGANSSPSQQ